MSSRPMRGCASMLAGAALLAGCFGEETTDFPPGLDPIVEEFLAPPIEGTADEPFPEELTLERDNIDRGPAVHARFIVHAPLLDVFDAIADPDVLANRRQYTRHSVEFDVEPEYDRSYVVHVVIENIITVEYDITFRHGVVEGTLEEPTLTATNFQKTFGSTAVQDLRASVVARALTDTVTEVEAVEVLRTVSSDHEIIERYWRDVFANVQAHVRGEPLPTF